MKAGWKTVKLSEIALVGAGNSAPQETDDFSEDGPLFVRTSDVGEVKFGTVVSANDRLSPRGAKGMRLWKSGTILIPKSGASTFVNHRVILGTDAHVSSHLATITADTAKADPRFLLYYLITVRAQDLIQDQSYPSLKLPEIGGIEIPLPPLAEQKRIVALLDEAFAGIDEAKAKVEANLQDAENLFKTHLTTVFTQRSYGWKEKSIYEVCERLHQGLNTAGEKVQFFDSGYPIIQTRNIEGGKIDIDNKMKYMSEADWQLYKEKYRPEIGDVFFTNIGTIGKTAIVTTERDYLIHWNIFKLRPLPGEITPEFLRYSLEQLTLSGYFERMQKGGTVSFVTKKMISEAQIMAPNIVEQKDVTNMLDNLRVETKALTSLYYQKLIELTELKNSLLAQAFAGELTA